jgi:hypothetical protein
LEEEIAKNEKQSRSLFENFMQRILCRAKATQKACQAVVGKCPEGATTAGCWRNDAILVGLLRHPILLQGQRADMAPRPSRLLAFHQTFDAVTR